MTRIIPLLLIAAAAGAAERINHEGRILGNQVAVTTPTLFNTPTADAVVASMQILPRDNAWNEDVSRLPLLANSAAMIAKIRSDLAVANRQRLVMGLDMNYVLVPDSQPKIDINFVDYPGESDDLDPAHSTWGLWPIPSNMPIEGWPAFFPGLTNEQYQRDVNGTGGDRHSVVVMPGAGWTWETWQALLTTGTPAWQASNGAKFTLTTNAQRPAGWTSGDAAGLSLFAAAVRYDEAERGMVEHAMRLVVKASRKSYLYPATHQAGSTTDPDTPAMGQRIRLKSSFVIPASWSKEERAIALALKKYGALVADNGSFFWISIAPDDRWPANCFSHLVTSSGGNDLCDVNNFEVVQSTGPTGGPRSPGAPTANAGADQSVALSAGATLVGTTTGTGITTKWYVYPYATPPGTVTFGSPNALTTTVGFSAAGTYTLMLSASDGVHATAYDAVIVTVTNGGGTTTGGTTSGTTTGGTTTGGTTTGSTTSGATGSTTSGTTGGSATSSGGGTSTSGGTGGAPVGGGGGSGSGGCGLGSAFGVLVAIGLVAMRRRSEG
jgi:hypothetical protein